jgi:hypothetical protein
MDAQTALHTAARRYCVERAPALDPRQIERFLITHGQQYDPHQYFEVLGSAAKISILGAILDEIERVCPGNYPSVESLRENLLSVGRDVSTAVPETPTNSDVAQEEEEERTTFLHFVRDLPPAALRTVEPLPYYRELQQAERDLLWSRVTERWGIAFDKSPSFAWYPLRKC